VAADAEPVAADAEPVAADADPRAGAAPLSPSVRRLVAEHALDAATIPATGRGGRLTKEDVVRHIEDRAPGTAEQRGPSAAAATERPGHEPVATAAPPAGARAPGSVAPAEQAPPADAAPVPEPGAPRGVPAGAPTETAAGVPRGVAAIRPRLTEAGEQAGADETERVRMTPLRRRIAERLVEAQRTAAILTTFNEVDMSAVMAMRRQYRERFRARHGVDLGLMSLFARAVVLALGDVPIVNAAIDGDQIVYHRAVHLGIAVATPRGLIVPVVRHADRKDLAGLDRAIAELAGLAREGKVRPDHLSGGTFTITNGGIFGSLLSTPILNPPQSGILGMHKIQERPIALDGQVVIRPMMYVALSYDHRLVDGEQAVTFLVRVKERLEDPVRMLLDV
jgi:2-oxoglutarate dehydrogenase E2 component (dihydrolipoamide succinyltransferase)